MPTKRKHGNPFRHTLPGGSACERGYTTDAVGSQTAHGNWFWVVRDPDRRPVRKKINLHTKDKTQALRMANEYAQRRLLGAFDPWTDAALREGVAVTEAAKAYIAGKRREGRAQKTVDTDQRLLEAFERSLPSGSLVRHVGAKQVARFLDAPKQHGKKPGKAKPGPAVEKSDATKLRYRAVLHHFFGFCVEQGYAQTNPAADVRTPSVQANPRDHLAPDEEQNLLRAVQAAEVVTGRPHGWLLDWIVFGVEMGLRPGEQQKLRWSAIRFNEGTRGIVRVGMGHRTKTRDSTRNVTLSVTARAILQRRQAERTTEADGPVFTGATGGQVDLRYLSKRLQHYAAGTGKNITAYSLRHTFGTRMLSAEVSAYTVARDMGTSVKMIELHYGHEDHAAAAAGKDRAFPARPGFGGAGDGAAGREVPGLSRAAGAVTGRGTR